MVVSRAVRAAIVLSLIAVGGSALAGTPALVVDVASGRVLFAERATDPWYPASITKLMTTYVALDMVRDGRASMNQLLTLSAEAAAQPPSKMGFKPGTQITLENALKIVMVKSANDLAMMVGENLGGSVEGFAAMMNDTARRLGMHESRWYNPNGLPDARQYTSARDMAILARALLRDFPEQEGLFHIGAVQLGRKIMRNHNGLLGRYPGADGMKTGFICMGGFNVVASATQNGRRLITVVMGYPSARERDLRAADLFDQGFNSFGGWGAQKLEDLPPSAALSPPDMRPMVCGGRKRQPQEDDEATVAQGPGGNAENGGVAALFSSATLAGSGGGNVPQLGSRRTLGPRVAFQPIPVWLGASPGSAPDEDGGKAQSVRIAAKPVRTKTLSRSASGGQLPSTAQAFTSANTAPTVDGKSAKVDTLKAAPAPHGRAALRANLDAKPAAETRPRASAIGGERRVNLGGITPKPIAITAEREMGSSESRKLTKPAGKSAAKHASPPAKPAATAKVNAKAAASTSAKKADKKADKPKRASAAE
jgi:D-alanyl-D-alanine carboxypeptidase